MAMRALEVPDHPTLGLGVEGWGSKQSVGVNREGLIVVGAGHRATPARGVLHG